jgi:hypothetical protein
MVNGSSEPWALDRSGWLAACGDRQAVEKISREGREGAKEREDYFCPKGIFDSLATRTIDGLNGATRRT